MYVCGSRRLSVGKFFANGPTFSAIHGEGSAVGQAVESEPRIL
jgi:hypothetical protein